MNNTNNEKKCLVCKKNPIEIGTNWHKEKYEKYSGLCSDCAGEVTEEWTSDNTDWIAERYRCMME